MIDAPRWTREVIGPLEERGGLAHVLLSHRDDVADAATDVLVGGDPTTVTGRVIAFPVPGHTRGSVMYLVDGHLLLSGDSLSWHPRRRQLHAFRRACWYSWPEQTASLARLAQRDLGFDRLFCGHGWNHDADGDEFAEHLRDLVARMPSMG